MMENKNNPVTDVLLPYLTCVLLIPFMFTFLLDINYFIIVLAAVLLFHPYFNYLVDKWLREIRKTDISETEIDEIMDKYGLKC